MGLQNIASFIHSASICLLVSGLYSCLPVPPDGVGVSLKVHESGMEKRPKNNKMAPCKKNVGVRGDKNRCLPLHVPDNDDLDATALASSPELNTHTHEQTQSTTTTFSTLSNGKSSLNKKQPVRKWHHQISFGYKSDGSQMDVTTALGRQTGHKAQSVLKLSNLPTEITCIIGLGMKLLRHTNWY